MQIDPLNIIFLVGFVVYLTIRGVYEARAKVKETENSHSDTLEYILLIPVGISSLIFPLIFLFTNWFSFSDFSIPVGLRWVGVAIMLAALWLFWRSHADLGQNWSATIQHKQNHELITHGVYRSIRHPMYASIFLWDIAQGMILQNWLAGWAAFTSFLFLYLFRVPKEERMMIQHFGTQYTDYVSNSGKLFPKIPYLNAGDSSDSV